MDVLCDSSKTVTVSSSGHQDLLQVSISRPTLPEKGTLSDDKSLFKWNEDLKRLYF
ncbi:MAG: hypothetical protein PHQ81_07750 [Methanofollis sp.]|nr:hypothetical protein [Methanofollis sp.]